MSIRNWCLCGVFAAAFFVTFTAAAARTVYTYTDGSEVEIAHADAAFNNTDSVLNIGEDSVIRLTGQGDGTGLFDFKPVVHCTNGQARITVDATAAAQAGFTGIRWYNHVRARGGITVKGLDKIVFGTASKVNGGTTDANTYLDAVFSFVDAEGVPVAAPAGITVTNAAVLGVAQTCPLIPAANAWIWPYGANTYGTPGETLDITGYNLGIVSVNGIAADAIRVPAGSQLAARPCGIMYEAKNGDAYFYKWGGEKQTMNKPVILDGGSFYIKSTPNYTHTGAITGNGSLLYEGGASAIGTFSSPGFTGAITNNGNRLVFGGSITAPVVINAGSATQVRTLAFEPANYLAGSTVTTGPVTGNSFDTSAVEVQVKQTLTLASVANRLAFTHAGSDAVAVVESVQSDAILAVEDGMELRILAQDNETKVVPRNTKGSGNWTISGPASGERVKVLLAQTPAGARLAFGGKIHVTGIPADVAEITILDGADVTGDLPDTCPVISLGGKWQYRDWHDKIALWCDASAANSFVYAQNVNADLTIGESKIFWWHDCRSEQRNYSFVMSRFKTNETANVNKYPSMYPAVASGDDVLDDKPYLKCSLSAQTRMGMLDPDSTISGQNSNNNFTYIPSKYAIVVARNVDVKYGSAILCSREGLLAASGKGYNSCIFTNENLRVYRDGVEIDPTSTTWGNSEWHIYSFTTDNASINGLANSDDAGKSDGGGGFDYAEIMIFDMMPTEAERRVAEEYLSAKWGLAIEDSEVDAETVSLSGYGETTLAKPTRLAGSFGGTLDLAGFTLELAAGQKPISEDQIPAEDRALWIDPTFSGSVMMSEEAGKTDEVAAAFSRTAAGLDAAARYYLQSAYDPTGVTNRRPRLVTSRSGGVANKWFDFLDGYGDGLGNNLMVCAMPLHEPFANYAFTGSGSPWYSITYRTIIMVIDSSRGGGSPFLHYAGGGDTGNRGTNPTMDTPIFNNCTETFTNANVYLNGVAVAPNPAQAGFSGRCEVYSTVLPDGGVGSVKAFAYCNSTYSILNQEKIGEILMYNTRLDDATRESIEAYLMRKWLGKVPEGYSDFSDLTVTGSGTLKVSSIADLPQLGAGFTGDVKIAASRLAFTFAEGTTVANEAISAANTAFTLPSAVTVDVSFAARPEAGRYTLFTANVANEVAWTKGTVVNAKAKNVRLVWDAAAKTLFAEVRPSGTAIILR